MLFKIKCKFSHYENGFPVVDVTVSDDNGSATIPVNVKRLLTADNTKTRKGEKRGFLTMGLSMSPHKTAGLGNVCTSAGLCIETCLDETGLGSVFRSIHAYRAAKTWLWFNDKKLFWEILETDLARATRKADRENLELAFRPNMFSDNQYEKFPAFRNLLDRFPAAFPYDYTKHHKRMFGSRPDRYHLTYSRSENRDQQAVECLDAGFNVAVVFNHDENHLPETWFGFPVINGNENDIRFIDPPASVIGLPMKYGRLAQAHRMLETGFAFTDPNCEPMIIA
jgi:hypothetical protein